MASKYGTNALSKFSPDTELVLYPLQDKLTLGDKSLDLSGFKLSRLFFILLSLGSSSCWRSYGLNSGCASRREGKPITARMLLQKIKSEEFDIMNDHDAVGLCLLGVLELVLLGYEVRYTVSNWCFMLVDNINAWNMYLWGSYVWPTLYEQLRDAIRKRWEAHFVTEREPDSGPPKYLLMGFTWTFKSVILEHLLGVSKEVNVFVILNGARPRPRLTLDVVEARADWWLASNTFFDDDIRKLLSIPPLVNQHSRDDVPEYIYRHMVEHDNLFKAHDEKIKSHDILIKQMYDDWQGFLQVGPRIFTSPGSSFFDCVRTPTSQFNKPIFDQPTPSSYPASFPPTPHTATPRAQQGFASWSSTYPVAVNPTP
ncbi:hypothetical protein Tco_0989805 [Tanacetum coccineum]|uniref:Phospholipase-like protein n=1 Tax=Tanacetum coccineum TaxID=301880 RepID=A0ABQ5EUN3_9ASTR